MDRSGLLSIGSFAMLTGLSIAALRHYDEVEILTPASIDDRTGYRYYGRDQIRTGRMIVALRAVDLPLDELKRVLSAQDDEGVHAVLVDHRVRLAARAHDLKEQLRTVDEFIEKGVDVPAIKGNRISMINIAVNDVEIAKKFYE